MLRLLSEHDVSEAIWLASPQTSNELERARLAGEYSPKLVKTMAKYVQRLAGRPTPFGLFAGCATGSIGEKTEIEFLPRSDYVRHVRLDNDVLYRVAEQVGKDPSVRRLATYSPNTSLYRSAGRLYWVKTTTLGRIRDDALVSTDDEPHVTVALRAARSGATLAEIAAALRDIADDVNDAAEDELEQFLFDMIDQCLLVASVQPPVITDDALAHLLRLLAQLGECQSGAIVASLQRASEVVTAVTRTPLSCSAEAGYRALGEIRALVVGDTDADIVQVDMSKPAAVATIAHDIVSSLGPAIEALRLMNRHGDDERLRAFREAFKARYELREIDLCDALDEDCGIGFQGGNVAIDVAPLLAGLHFPEPDRSREVVWTKRDLLLLRRVNQLSASKGELVLTDDDIGLLTVETPAVVSDALSAMITVGKSKSGEEEIFLKQLHGPSGVNLMARFCHTDPSLKDLVRKHVQNEERAQPQAVFAEIVHLPSGRLGNVVLRPRLRDHEIAYLGHSGCEGTERITLSDLSVCVRDDRVVLRSRSLNREIVPRLTNMHSFARGLPVYAFLAALQFQGVDRFLSWQWGSIKGEPWLPRVRHRNVVLARAQWQVAAILREGSNVPSLELLRKVDQWRLAGSMPRFCVLVDGDNELPIDWENPISVQTLIGELRETKPQRPGRETFLAEMWPQPGASPVRGREGTFSHEIVIPITKAATAVGAAVNASTSNVFAGALPRSFAPGSEWTYLKIYTGGGTADRVILDVDRQLNEMSGDYRGRWFFVRYADPEFHLRIRIHRGEQKAMDTLSAATTMMQSVLKRGLAWRVQMDTYEREVERYGGAAGVALSERLFCLDSWAVVRLLKTCQGDKGGALRWQLCLLAWHHYLTVAIPTVAERLEFVRALRAGAERTTTPNKALRVSLGDRFRRERPRLERLLYGSEVSVEEAGEGIQVLEARTKEAAPLLGALAKGMHEAGRFGAFKSILASHLHMTANRILRSQHSQQELVMYDFLTRLYESDSKRHAAAPAPPLGVRSAPPGESARAALTDRRRTGEHGRE